MRVTDAADPAVGVHIQVFFGLLAAHIAVDCGPTIEIVVPGGAAYDGVVTCGSATVEVISGMADVTTTVSGNTVTASLSGGDSLSLAVDPTTGALAAEVTSTSSTSEISLTVNDTPV